MGCLMAWPTRRELWVHHMDAATAEYAATRRGDLGIRAGDDDRSTGRGRSSVGDAPVRGDGESSSRSTTRGCVTPGPIFTLDADGRRTGVDFVFNSWGEKFAPVNLDDAVAAALLDHSADTRRPSPMVLEGGSITVDGTGNARFTTEQCVPHPSRNPEMSRADIEAEWHRTLGVDTVIWLPWGLVEDIHTDGHVDNVCAFVRPGVVITQSCDDRSNPNDRLMRENLAVLHAATDTTGATLDVIEVPQMSYFEIDDAPYRTSYLNFYVANGGIVVPTADHPNDPDALAIIADAFPDREVVGVTSRVLAFGGGGIHCITQQLPSGAAG